MRLSVRLLVRVALLLMAVMSLPEQTQAQSPATNAPVTNAAPATNAPPAKPPAPPPPPLPAYPVKVDWRWVKSAVFVPTNCVNEAQQWDAYDPAVNERELANASFYGFNCVRVFLHYAIYLKKKDALLAQIEDFLQRADKHRLKVEFVFFDDCWNQPEKEIANADYKYPAPLYGVHNSRWLSGPGDVVKSHFVENEATLKAYVQDIVNAHKDDKRILFWETYNEPDHSPGTKVLLENALKWIHETGTTIPVTATAGDFPGGYYSDFYTWHNYNGDFGNPHDALALNTECMNRQDQSVPGVVEHFKDKSGFTMWEAGIGRDNCRFPWKDDRKAPATTEPDKPFHGVIYADGHPWALDDAKALMGAEAFQNAAAFAVKYYKDETFTALAKTSITPRIDFDLVDEPGYGSPDASAGVPKDHFSISWTGTLRAPASGPYTIFADCDDRVKITVAGKVVLDKTAAGRAEVSGKVDLVEGQGVPIHVDYAHGTGAASLHVTWSGPKVNRDVLLPAAPK